MSNELAITAQEANIANSDAAALEQTFSPFFQQAQEWKQQAEAIQVKDAEDKDTMQKARKARLKLKEIRVSCEKKRKELKEESLRKGKAIDGMANVIKYLIVPIEEHLEEQEKFVERQEQKRKQELKEKREQELVQFEFDTSFCGLAEMPEDQYAKLLERIKHDYEMAKETERKAEEERIEREKKEAEERERIRKENEHLKKEAEEKEKALEAERKKAEEEQRKKEEEHQAQLEAERKERERIEAEERARREAEEKAQQEAEEKKRQERMAPDREKLQHLAERIAGLEIPEVESDEAKAVVKKSIELLSRVSKFVKTESTNL